MIYFLPLVSAWIVSAALIAAVLALAFSLRPGKPHLPSTSGKERALVLLRAASFICILLMLLSPVLNRTQEDIKSSNIAFMVDSSLSMGCADEKGGMTRLQAAAEFLRRGKFRKISKYPISFYTFSGTAEKKGSPAEIDDGKAAGGTDFAAAVKQVDKDIGFADTAAIVLLTDGNDNYGFKGSGIEVPIFCVRTGGDLADAANIGFKQFRSPEKVRVGEELELKIPVASHGFGDSRNIELAVFEDGAAADKKVLALKEGVAVESVRHVFKTEGAHILELKLDELPGELTYLDNFCALSIEVLKSESEVAAYFPELSNSFRPLMRFLEQGQEKFTAFYKVADGKFALKGIEPDETFKDGLPQSPEKMAHVGTFILAAHNRPALTDAEENVLEKYVSAGGSLILLGGKDSFGPMPETSPLKRLSPFVHSEESFTSGTFKVSAENSTGSGQPVYSTSFQDRMGEIIARNAADPEFVLKSVNTVKSVKAGADVLLWVDSHGARLPLVAVQRFGRGVVIGVLTNSLPLWGGTSSRTANFNDFWKQLLSFSLAANESDILRLSVDRTEIPAGGSLEVMAVATVPEGREAELKVNADIADAATGEVKASMPMERRGSTFQCVFTSLKPGKYLLKATCTDKDKLLRQRFRIILCGETIAETRNLASDASRFLDYSIARHIYNTEERDRLEDDLAGMIPRSDVENETRLVFDTPWFFLALLALLTAEWILRRKFNLA